MHAATLRHDVLGLFRPMIWLAILAIAALAGLVSGIAGFGGSNIMMPILVVAFGAKDAVPVMGLAGLLANLARVAIWWREIDFLAAGVYALCAVPAVVAGARLFLVLDARIVEGVLGAFMLAMVPLRRWFLARRLSLGPAGLALAGLGIGFLTGLVASTGPINTPFFLAYGLVKGAYIATEALGSLAVYAAKTAVFGQAGALPPEVVARGLLIGAAMMLGSWGAKGFVAAMDGAAFQRLLEALMIVAGVVMMVGAVTGAGGA
jgi:hypothetical protein